MAAIQLCLLSDPSAELERLRPRIGFFGPESNQRLASLPSLSLEGRGWPGTALGCAFGDDLCSSDPRPFNEE